MKILITGTAGFIGFHLANRLLQEGHSVVGVDQINDYYDVQLKKDRLACAGISMKKGIAQGTILERKVEWVLKYFAEVRSQIVVKLGYKKKDPYVRDLIKTHNPNHISIHGYLPPISYYLKSRFFLLSADIVFANNALLEAMSYGFVPLVSDVSGSNSIVDHLRSGYIFPHTYEGFKEAIEWAIKLDKVSYDKLSLNARLKVEKDFSFEKFKAGYKKMIDSI